MQRQAPQGLDEEKQAFFTRLVSEHARSLYRVAWSVLRQREDAEDCVQEALLKVYRGESWRRMENARAFLASAVWRAAVDRRRARTAAEDIAELPLEDGRPTPESVAAGDEEKGMLRRFIEELPEELRRPLMLSLVEEMSSREIGEVMGIPEGTVRTRLMRARSELRERWETRRTARAMR